MEGAAGCVTLGLKEEIWGTPICVLTVHRWRPKPKEQIRSLGDESARGRAKAWGPVVGSSCRGSAGWEWAERQKATASDTGGGRGRERKSSKEGTPPPSDTVIQEEPGKVSIALSHVVVSGDRIRASWGRCGKL